MGTFFKEHGYNMVKLFINQIGITVFGTMLMLATTGNSTLYIIASVFSILFFLGLNYSSCWELGAKDKIRVDGGRLRSMPYKGALLALGANIPNYLLTVTTGICTLIDTAAAQSVGTVCTVIFNLLNGMYIGVVNFFQHLIYRSDKISAVIELLRTSAEPSADAAAAVEMLESGFTSEPLSRAYTALAQTDAPTKLTEEAAALLESAIESPTLAQTWWWNFLITVPAILVCMLAYWLGSKNIRISSVFGIKPKQANAKKKN